MEKERIALEKWIENPDNYFLTAFRTERNLLPEIVERLREYSISFRETYARALEIQEQRIVSNALSRKFDGNFAKFVLQNKAGWKEKQEISGDASNPLAVLLAKIGDTGSKSVEPIEVKSDADWD